MWLERFPKDLRAYAPFPVTKESPDGPIEVLVLEGVEYRQWRHSVGVPRAEVAKTGPLSRTYDDGLAGNRDPHARLNDMAIDGVDAQIIVRNDFPQFLPKELRARWGIIRAYNDWIGEFCRVAPDRLIGVGELPTWDMELMLQEAVTIRELGMRAVLMPICPGFVGDWSHPAEHNYTSLYWEPLWKLLEDLELTIVAHVDAFAVTPGLAGYATGMGTAVNLMTGKGVAGEMFVSMMLGKVFDRHPTLKVVLNETGIGWAAHLLSWADVLWEVQPTMYKPLGLKHMPKEYFNEHVIASSLWDSVGVASRDLIGIESFAWCSDYPENYGTFGKARQQIDKDLAGTTDAERHAILAGNAIRAFRL
jgi:predicted TIM-barrel fold metal-dependent hydrolase